MSLPVLNVDFPVVREIQPLIEVAGELVGGDHHAVGGGALQCRDLGRLIGARCAAVRSAELRRTAGALQKAPARKMEMGMPCPPLVVRIAQPLSCAVNGPFTRVTRFREVGSKRQRENELDLVAA